MLRKTLAAAALSSFFLFIAGCGGGGSTVASAPPPGAPVLTLSSTGFSFGPVTVGQTSTTQILELTNNSSTAITLSGDTLTGDSTDFTSATTCTATLAPNAYCTFTIAFAPQTTGTLTATITITDNASNSPQSVTLSGTGAAAVTAPVLTVTPPSLAFGSQTVSTTTAAQAVTLTNTGNGTLTFTSGITLSDTADYSLTTTCAATLAASASCALSVTFHPQTAATLNGSISIANNATGSPQTIALTGAGTPAVTAPVLTATPPSLAFGNQTVSTTAAAQAVTLTNTGNGTLTFTSGITLSDTADYSLTTTCAATLAANASCALSVTFHPQTAATLNGSISIANNATGSPQTIALTGAGTAVPTPTATLSAATIAFGSQTVNTTTAAPQPITLTNTGTATLTGISLSLTGTGAAAFANTTTCTATLAVNASCTISASFTPTAAAPYTATISIADNAAGSPQTITLTGTGTSSAPTVTRTLYVFPAAFPETANPDASVSALYALINGAQKSVDMTMYELEDTTFSGDLVADCARGVTVRVILSSSEKSSNTPAYDQLNTAGVNCSAVLSNTAFENTHQKTITVDDTTTAIMSLNLQTQYYTTTRDFALIENDPADIAAIEATFNADYAAGTPYQGTQGASDFSYQPGGGDTTVVPPNGDLIWSPTTAQADMLALINNATKTIILENEEMDASNIVSALEAACQRGVTVHIAMTNDDNEYGTEFTALQADGCGVNVYPDTNTGFYVHAKAVVADYGLSTQSVYMGSINYSTASMTENRELGMYITDPTIVNTLETTMAADYAGGTPY